MQVQLRRYFSRTRIEPVTYLPLIYLAKRTKKLDQTSYLFNQINYKT